MSENKSYDPSKKKLKKARDEGKVPRAKEITVLIQLSICYLLILFLAGNAHTILDLYHKVLKNNEVLVTFAEILDFKGIFVSSLYFTLIVSLLLFCVTVFAELSQVGIILSFDKIKLSFSNIGIINGFKKILGGSNPSIGKLILNVIEIIFLCVALSSIFVFYILIDLPKIIGADLLEIEDIYNVFWLYFNIAAKSIFVILLIFAVYKYLLSKHMIKKELMMSFDELKQELKEDEGDPHTKNERKSIHHEVLLHGLLESVKKAKVIISDF